MSHHYSGPNLVFPRGDAADVFVTVITNGKLTGDGIGPHGDLLAEFLYVGPPHQVRDVEPRLGYHVGQLGA